MDERIEFYLKDFYKAENGASEEDILKIQLALDFSLPYDYIGFMREANGGEGGVGEGGLLLFTLDELIIVNNDYELLMKEIPEYFLFGKDAADTGFAFHKKNKTYHAFGLMSNFETDEIEFYGNTFLDFLECLYNRS